MQLGQKALAGAGTRLLLAKVADCCSVSPPQGGGSGQLVVDEPPSQVSFRQKMVQAFGRLRGHQPEAEDPSATQPRARSTAAPPGIGQSCAERGPRLADPAASVEEVARRYSVNRATISTARLGLARSADRFRRLIRRHDFGLLLRRVQQWQPERGLDQIELLLPVHFMRGERRAALSSRRRDRRREADPRRNRSPRNCSPHGGGG